ncbi:hypothetical protein OAB01_03060 [Bacteroidia bacterium]|nr:hypothetical protein [Bacteroidia bacterium]
MLKAQKEALEKARKGYNYGFESKKYGFVYGDIALQQKEKMDLRKAIELIEKHPESLTAQDNEKFVTYYKFLGEDDMVKKYEKEKKEQAAIAAKEKAKQDKKNKRKRYGPPFGLAISTNPANLLWNTFPVAADLRLGKTIHQFRVNNHNGHSSKTMFGNYSRDNELDDKKSWLINNGRDYSYSLLFPVGDGMIFGFQGFYGKLNLNQDTAIGTRLSDNVTSSVMIDPDITRYGGALQWGYRIADRRKHYYFAFYYLMDAGCRTIDYNYNPPGVLLPTDISDPEIFEFQETTKSFGYRHKNWNKVYGIFNLRLRVGITLF